VLRQKKYNFSESVTNVITKAVIPAAGLGTRLLPTTKELPKEMMPIFFKRDDEIILKPTLQIIFEELYDSGIREFCFIVGRGKRAIEDHFTPDYNFLEYLKQKGKEVAAKDIEEFYERIENSVILFVNQPQPKGFGDAVLKAKAFVGNEPFIVHAGDAVIFSENNQHIKKVMDIFCKKKAEAVFLLKKVENPKMYGVIEPGEEEGDIIEVKRIVEKPETPPSNLAVVPIYAFDPVILKALEKTEPSKRGEVELTDAIQKIIEWNFKVYAIKPPEGQIWLDIGTPQNYWKALQISYNL